MKKAWFILIPTIVVMFVITQSDSADEEYPKEIHEFWEDRHDFFRTSEASPFIQKGQEYHEVNYYEPDPDFKVKGKIERFTKRETLKLGNSDGTTTTYLKFGLVTFKIKGEESSLLILKALGFGHQYLLAFGDDTSGESTYGGGRYLDVIVGKSDFIDLDFNKSYNPYCAYFDDFTCPLPPIENLLEVPITAGEKNYEY